MLIGAEAVLQSVQLIEKGDVKPIPQNVLLMGNLKTAHKIFKDNCIIPWENEALVIHNFIRGLSPFPTAFTYLTLKNEEKILFKVFKAEYEIEKHQMHFGHIVTDSKNYLKVACKDGYISLLHVQMAGKKAMSILEFLRGFDATKIKLLGM